MSSIKTLWRCAFSPRLFKIYEAPCVDHMVDKSYEPKKLERWSSQVVGSFAAMWSISVYVVPLIATFMYHRNYSLTDNAFYLSKLAAGISALFVTSLAARGYSRVNNPVYAKFVQTLHEAHVHYNEKTKQQLLKYDFEFWGWPVDFDASKFKSDKISDKITLEKIAQIERRSRSSSEFLCAIPCKLLSYLIAHTFAIRLIYPGSLSIMNWVLASTLTKGRKDLIKQGGERCKLITVDKNRIDAMFIDRRNKSANGNILVITCEGNCGFYETGIISTPLSKGYSVLGWNHPGFGECTGAPYPSQEENAMDCIMQFAIERLKFPEERIILYGWSIGGYTSTWAAMNYRSVHSLVLDATFDDVLPLAIKAMPQSLEGLVRNVIRSYFNLNIIKQLNRYNGPVLLIRRTEDEILCIPNNSFLAGNRGNVLLTKLFLRRYPHLFANNPDANMVLKRLLCAEAADRESVLYSYQVDEKRCLDLIAADIRGNNGRTSYPCNLGHDCRVKTKLQLLLFLTITYMKDQSSTHCIPLAVDLFHPGWDPMSAIAAVK